MFISRKEFMEELERVKSETVEECWSKRALDERLERIERRQHELIEEIERLKAKHVIDAPLEACTTANWAERVYSRE